MSVIRVIMISAIEEWCVGDDYRILEATVDKCLENCKDKYIFHERCSTISMKKPENHQLGHHVCNKSRYHGLSDSL